MQVTKSNAAGLLCRQLFGGEHWYRIVSLLSMACSSATSSTARDKSMPSDIGAGARHRLAEECRRRSPRRARARRVKHAAMLDVTQAQRIEFVQRLATARRDPTSFGKRAEFREFQQDRHCVSSHSSIILAQPCERPKPADARAHARANRGASVPRPRADDGPRPRHRSRCRARRRKPIARADRRRLRARPGQIDAAQIGPFAGFQACQPRSRVPRQRRRRSVAMLSTSQAVRRAGLRGMRHQRQQFSYRPKCLGSARCGARAAHAEPDSRRGKGRDAAPVHCPSSSRLEGKG